MPLLSHCWTAIGPFAYLPIGAYALSRAVRPAVEVILTLWGVVTRDSQRRAYCERLLAEQRAERMESRRLRRVRSAADHGPYVHPAVGARPPDKQ